MAHHPPVELEALLLCESYTKKPFTGEVESARFYGPFVSAQFPSKIGRDVWALALIGRVRTPTAVRMLIRREHDHPDTKPLLDRSEVLQPPIDLTTAAPLIVNIKDLELPTPGEYLIHVMAGDRELGMRRFHALLGLIFAAPPS